jgi:hypothetical protein
MNLDKIKEIAKEHSIKPGKAIKIRVGAVNSAGRGE